MEYMDLDCEQLEKDEAELRKEAAMVLKNPAFEPFERHGIVSKARESTKRTTDCFKFRYTRRGKLDDQLKYLARTNQYDYFGKPTNTTDTFFLVKLFADTRGKIPQAVFEEYARRDGVKKILQQIKGLKKTRDNAAAIDFLTGKFQEIDYLIRVRTFKDKLLQELYDSKNVKSDSLDKLLKSTNYETQKNVVWAILKDATLKRETKDFLMQTFGKKFEAISLLGWYDEFKKEKTDTENKRLEPKYQGEEGSKFFQERLNILGLRETNFFSSLKAKKNDDQIKNILEDFRSLGRSDMSDYFRKKLNELNPQGVQVVRRDPRPRLDSTPATVTPKKEATNQPFHFHSFAKFAEPNIGSEPPPLTVETAASPIRSPIREGTSSESSSIPYTGSYALATLPPWAALQPSPSIKASPSPLVETTASTPVLFDLSPIRSPIREGTSSESSSIPYTGSYALALRPSSTTRRLAPLEGKKVQWEKSVTNYLPNVIPQSPATMNPLKSSETALALWPLSRTVRAKSQSLPVVLTTPEAVREEVDEYLYGIDATIAGTPTDLNINGIIETFYRKLDKFQNYKATESQRNANRQIIDGWKRDFQSKVETYFKTLLKETETQEELDAAQRKKQEAERQFDLANRFFEKAREEKNAFIAKVRELQVERQEQEGMKAEDRRENEVRIQEIKQPIAEAVQVPKPNLKNTRRQPSTGQVQTLVSFIEANLKRGDDAAKHTAREREAREQEAIHTAREREAKEQEAILDLEELGTRPKQVPTAERRLNIYRIYEERMKNLGLSERAAAAQEASERAAAAQEASERAAAAQEAREASERAAQAEAKERAVQEAREAVRDIMIAITKHKGKMVEAKGTISPVEFQRTFDMPLQGLQLRLRNAEETLEKLQSKIKASGNTFYGVDKPRSGGKRTRRRRLKKSTRRTKYNRRRDNVAAHRTKGRR